LRTIPIPSKPKGDATIACLRFSPDGQRLLSCAAHDGTRLWEVASGKQLWLRGSTFAMAAFTPDGKTVAASPPGSGAVYLWDRGTRRDKSKRKVEGLTTGAFSADGRWLATAHRDGTVCLRDPNTAEERRRLTGHKDVAWETTFSADGKWLATVGVDSTLRVWEVLTGRELFRHQGPTGGLLGARFPADGRHRPPPDRPGGVLAEDRPGTRPARRAQD